jgi:enediyne biosynthesis protein E4
MDITYLNTILKSSTHHSFFLLVFFLACIACTNNKKNLFTEQQSATTHITFRNDLVETEKKNVLNYMYFYNGAGVAAGDLNNDGLADLVFTGNQTSNKLYLNKGDFTFQDITQSSGIANYGGWNTGVSLADINADGWLDIYVCRSGSEESNERKNLLFINNKDNTFTERAAAYGLDDSGYSTQAAFFDYDKDDDLDVFILNHSIHRFSIDSEFSRLRHEKNSIYGSKLYQNNHGVFKDVSEEAGIISNVISFGLGVAIGDVNNDTWPDFYVSNDFKEQDYLYINKGNGTFANEIETRMDHVSLFSMGSDFEDINNDGHIDLLTLDMLPDENHRLKMTSGAENFDKLNLLHQAGFHWQYMRNMLHLNDGTGNFSEVGSLSGISNSDWSWSPLFADFDNDGHKDLFITNGFVRDYTNMDFIKFVADNQNNPAHREKFKSVLKVIEQMPSSKISNYVFKNNGDLTFTNKNSEWGIDKMSISSGSAYADLDNDGDLDMVVNNINDLASVYKNNEQELLHHHYLKIKLVGTKGNTSGIGAVIKVYADTLKLYREHYLARGYESTVDGIVNFGLGTNTKIDSVVVAWPDGNSQKIIDVKTNQLIILDYKNAAKADTQHQVELPYFQLTEDLVSYQHTENDFNDFKVQNLLPHFLSRFGPCMAKADVNADGLEDLFIGGAKGYPGTLFIQNKNGSLNSVKAEVFKNDSIYEDTDALFFDCDKDGDQDLYVVSGGYEFLPTSYGLQDRLYLNDGKGHFSHSTLLPEAIASKSCVKATDFDNDGDVDLFVGGRMISGNYPEPPTSFLFTNDGLGKMTDASNRFEGGATLGMVTDAAWADLNKDGWQDLVVVGEWMPIKVFINYRGIFKEESSIYIKQPSAGWWNKILAADFDKDGDTDFVIGNLGLNAQIKASEKEPVKIYYTDIDNNGTIDPIITSYIQGKQYPLPFLDDLISQVPILKKKFLYYKDYASAGIEDIVGTPMNLPSLYATTFQSVVLKNNQGALEQINLPIEAQFAPIFSILSTDVNNDGFDDIILTGNLTQTRVRFGRYDANHGMLFLGDGKCGFNYVPQIKSGLTIRGDVRSSLLLNNHLIFGINSGNLVALKKVNQPSKAPL